RSFCVSFVAERHLSFWRHPHPGPPPSRGRGLKGVRLTRVPSIRRDRRTVPARTGNYLESLGQLFVDFEVKVETIRRPEALVAELVDAQVSGTCGREVVEVRVFSRAPSVVRRDEH